MAKNAEAVVLNITYIVVQLDSCCGDMRTTFVFPNSPIHFVTTGVYRYTGTSNFPNTDGTMLEPGKCYTATLQPSLPPASYPAGPPIANIPMIDFGCQNQLCIDACEPPSCGCPPGYVVGSDGRCQKTSYVNPTCFPTTYTVSKGDSLCIASSFAYGLVGGVFYNDITYLPWPIQAQPSVGSFVVPTVLIDATTIPVSVINTIQNNVWGNGTGYSQADCANYRLNKVGVWIAPPRPLNQWIGFTYCVNIPTTKTYCIGIASDDAYKLYINGNLVIDHSNVGYGFSSWKIIPITLTAGNNVFDVRNRDSGGYATLGFEIYDATTTQLQAVTTANGTPGPTDLDQYIVFTTQDIIGQTWQVGETSGCNCPEGYSFFTCDGQNQCLQILYAAKTVCNVELTPCCGGGDPVIIDNSVLLSHIGEVVCIQNIDPNVGCWTIATTTDPVNYTGPVTLGNYTATCEGCVTLGCKTCPDNYFTLNDCCTNEPYLNSLGEILVLHYTGESVDGLTPPSLADVIITEILSEAIGGPIATGCFVLTEVSLNDFTTPLSVEPWAIAVSEVTDVPTCEDCKDCRVCYLLENCLDETDTLVTGTDLSQYVNQVITIEGCKDKCYIVSIAENCDDCSQPVVIINSFPPIVEPLNINSCTYTFPANWNDCLESIDLTIDDTDYNFIWSDIPTLFADFIALGLGNATISGGFVLFGTHSYGTLCFNYDPLCREALPQICIEPTCTLYNQLCTYSGITVGDAAITIVIDGVTYNSAPTLITNIGGLIAWLNDLELGIFATDCAYTSLGPCNIFGTGQALLGTLTVTLPNSPPNITEPVCEYGTSTPDCDACLPPPPPVVQPLLLNTRPVSPGYTTPGCSPEYTEKVNTNFSDQVYAQMLSVRYGLTVCCQEDLQYWEIKKQLLDFKAINDNNLTDCNNV